MFVIDVPSPQPRYLDIAEELRHRIAQGLYQPGDKLPSEAALCAEFGTSRGPVRQAIDMLRRSGQVAVSRGATPRVIAASAPAQPFESLVSFTEWAKAVGREPGQKTVELQRVRAGADVASRLSLETGEPVISVVRLRSLDGVPAMLERAMFPPAVGRWLFEPDFDPDAGSIYRQLRSCGVDLQRGQHVFDAVGADALDAEQLGVPLGTPLLRVRRTVTSAAGDPVEVADDRYLPGVTAISLSNSAGAPASILQLTPGKAVS